MNKRHLILAATQAVVRVAKQEKTEDGAAGMAGLAPEGSKPGAFAASMEIGTATASAIDLKKHKATLLFPDDRKETYPVRPDVDLTRRKVGEKVKKPWSRFHRTLEPSHR